MNTSKPKFNNVDEYIGAFPSTVQAALKKIRSAIKKAAPKANERISYGMPFYEYGGQGYQGRLIYFAAFKKHISLFITPGHSETVPSELKKYHVSKATYQFPLDQLFPYHLIETTVMAMVIEREIKNVKTQSIHKDILAYNCQQNANDKTLLDLLLQEISINLPNADNKMWHGHPVWFLDGNPIVGYNIEKRGKRLMFWSGASFDENGLNIRGEKFKDASVFYATVSDINTKDLKGWLKKSEAIQWDYKNIVKRKGVLLRLK